MASRRSKSIGTKVTSEEYDRIRVLAGEQPVSEWVRAALLRAAADPPAADAIVLAELLALRTILGGDILRAEERVDYRAC